MAEWRRLAGGYLRGDGAWFVERGARMATGGTHAWLIHRRVPEERVGRDSASAYDTATGNPLWLVDEHGWTHPAPAACPDALYAHDYDAGSLAEAKATVRSVEAAAD